MPGREITGSGLVAIVGNGRQTGGGIQVAPRACIDDGLLDVLVVRQISPTALLAAALGIATASARWRVYLLLANALAGGAFRRSNSSQPGW